MVLAADKRSARAREASAGTALFETGMGWIRATASERGITRIELLARAAGGRGSIAGRGKARQHLALLRREMSAYLRGRLKRFSVPVDLRRVSPFHAAALWAAARIPFGQVATYGELARTLGNPKACRAAGQAMARNPVPIVIPCHRVVASSGLGGYGAGLSLKVRLLGLEAAAAGSPPGAESRTKTRRRMSAVARGG